MHTAAVPALPDSLYTHRLLDLTSSPDHNAHVHASKSPPSSTRTQPGYRDTPTMDSPVEAMSPLDGLRRRGAAGGVVDSPDFAPSSSYPESPALEPITPPFRPVFSRTNSSTYGGSSTGTGSPQFDLSDEDLLSGLSLLDFLNVLDAHLELLTRPLRRKSVTWREKADRLVDQAKQKGRETFKVQLPSVPAFDLGESVGFPRDAKGTDDGTVGGDRRKEKRVLSARDKERLERKYREVRARMRDSIAKVVIKWEEE